MAERALRIINPMCQMSGADCILSACVAAALGRKNNVFALIVGNIDDG